MNRRNVDDPVYQLITGNFYQHCGDPEEALQQLLSEENPNYLQSAIHFLKEFLGNDTTEQEKNEFISYCADGIYFPAIGQTPVQWLEGVVSKIEDHLQNTK